VEGGEKQKHGLTGKNEVNHELPNDYRRHGQDSNQVPPECTP